MDTSLEGYLVIVGLYGKQRPVVVIKQVGTELICLPLTTTKIDFPSHPLFQYRIKLVIGKPTNVREVQVSPDCLDKESYLEGHCLLTIPLSDKYKLIRGQKNGPALMLDDVIDKTVRVLFPMQYNS